jgi:GMP synthase (glutamine-hydrolysing)
MRVYKTAITKQRLDLLREADSLVRDYSAATDFDNQVWQFPVILLPVGVESSPESVVLRPINSLDGMTADVVLMPDSWLDDLVSKLLDLSSIAAVFYDLTHKPPGTIEWE